MTKKKKPNLISHHKKLTSEFRTLIHATGPNNWPKHKTAKHEACTRERETRL
jgi:hypothetical protein